MLTALPTDMACREYLEGIMWGGVPTCPHCQSKQSYTLTTKGAFKGMYKCKECQKRYTVTYGTMLEGTHIPLRKWFIAIYIFSLHKKGISSHQLASDLEITQKTAWFMLGRIRLAFDGNTLENAENAIYEIDATYIGGKMKNKHAWQRKELNEQFGFKGNKTVVLGTLERDGNVTTNIVNSESTEDIMPIIAENMYGDATIVTDGLHTYEILGEEFTHVAVNHVEGEYVKGQFHINNIEGFWSQMKRGIYGIYHHVSPKHLHRYCAEFSYRYNVRKQTVSEKFNYSLNHSKRLTYATLIAKVD
jgi:transposase-like protein